MVILWLKQLKLPYYQRRGEDFIKVLHDMLIFDVVVCNTDWHSRYNLPAERLKLIEKTAGRISKTSMKKPVIVLQLYNDGVFLYFGSTPFLHHRKG